MDGNKRTALYLVELLAVRSGYRLAVEDLDVADAVTDAARGQLGYDALATWFGMEKRFDFERLVELCLRTHEETRRSAARAVDRSLVVRNWLFGWYIVEYEGGGSAHRDIYGKELIARLSARLKANGIKGCSPTNLRKCREFYQVFAEIQQTVSVGSGTSQSGDQAH